MIKFGTGGWRAVIAEDFTFDNVRRVAYAITQMMGFLDRRVVIGYDRRFLSENFARTAAEVVSAYDVTSYFVNYACPTPMIMFTVKHLNTPFGLIITASHNPAIYNGIKVITKGGKDADTDITSEVERISNAIEAKEIRKTAFSSAVSTGKIKLINPFNDYVDALISRIDIERIKRKNLRILIDPMFGVSRTTLQAVLITARCVVDTINTRRDTLFGGKLPSPSAKTLSSLKNAVIDGGYDLGIATDGDADRLGIIDDKGDFVHPNEIMALLYYYLLKYKGWEGGVVRNLCTTHLLDRIAADFEQSVYEVPVGFKYVSSKMVEKNALLGGESSGGLTIRGHIPGKDGIFAAALVVEMISRIGKHISEILNEMHAVYGKLYFSELDIRLGKVRDKEGLREIIYLKHEHPFGEDEIENEVYIDGLKLNFRDGGWLCIRLSGTEPLVRIVAESSSKDLTEARIEKMEKFVISRVNRFE
ncbi:MAG: phosphoglucomutase/phosphomannomutase family protein [Thermotoga sp.]|nr:MAG: phosphoglucomutase/phosphomannomutase family protein [Thermotoga sp.]